MAILDINCWVRPMPDAEWTTLIVLSLLYDRQHYRWAEESARTFINSLDPEQLGVLSELNGYDAIKSTCSAYLQRVVDLNCGVNVSICEDVYIQQKTSCYVCTVLITYIVYMEYWCCFFESGENGHNGWSNKQLSEKKAGKFASLLWFTFLIEIALFYTLTQNNQWVSMLRFICVRSG